MAEKSFWENVKDAAAACRELIVVLVVLVLVAAPDFAAGRLDALHLTRLEIPGFVLERVAEATQQTEEARRQVAVLEGNLQKIQSNLGSLHGRVADPAAKQEVQRLDAAVASSLRDAQSAAQKLQTSSTALEKLRTLPAQRLDPH